jgi:hypothetical protein
LFYQPHTHTGALLAYLCSLVNHSVLYSLTAATAAIVGHLLGAALGYEYTGKLLAITFFVVASPAFVHVHTGIYVAGARAIGIITGILWAFIMACVWFPRSASEQVGFRF